MAVLPPQAAPTFVRPALGFNPSPYRQNLLQAGYRLQKSPYRQLPVAAFASPPQSPQKPPPSPAPEPVVHPVVTASASAIRGNGMPQKYMQPAGFYLPAHVRHQHHHAIRPELAARVAFRRSMDAADRAFRETTREAYGALDRAMGRGV